VNRNAHNPAAFNLAVYALWRAGFDTFDIGQMLGETEATAMRALVLWRDAPFSPAKTECEGASS
jgi:hypothetical protein